MTRAASSHALARATASAAERDAVGPLFEGLALAAASDAWSWSGSFWANAPDPSAARAASVSHRNGFAIGRSFRPSRRRIRPDGEGIIAWVRGAASGRALCSFCGAFSQGPARPSSAAERGVDRFAEAFDDRLDLRGVHDEGRGQKHMIALCTVNGAAHRINHEAASHRLALDARVDLQRRVERAFAGAILDKLERPKEPAPANVADEGMVGEPLGE